jgi:hypothetical protein
VKLKPGNIFFFCNILIVCSIYGYFTPILITPCSLISLLGKAAKYRGVSESGIRKLGELIPDKIRDQGDAPHPYSSPKYAYEKLTNILQGLVVITPLSSSHVATLTY